MIVVAIYEEGNTFIMQDGRSGEKLCGLRRSLKGHIAYEPTIVKYGFSIQMWIEDEYPLRSEVKREIGYEYDTFQEKIDTLMMMCLESGKNLKFRDRCKE